MVLGQAIAYAVMVPIAEVGVDYGLTGQVAARATLGYWGARLLSSPYRVIAATYWFAAQAIAAAYAIQAIVQAMGAGKPPLVPIALAVAVFHATLAVLGFDVMRWLLRVVLPLSLAFVAIMVALYLSTDDPRFDVGRVFDSPDQHLTWVGFAGAVTLMAGSSLTLVTSVADFCRYTPTRRDVRIGLVSSALAAAAVGHVHRRLRGGGDGRDQPVRRRGRPDLELPAARPPARRGRRPGDLVEHRQRLHGRSRARELDSSARRLWATILRRRRRRRALGGAGRDRQRGALDRPSRQRRRAARAVMLVDYVVVKRRRIDVSALFDPDGPYRYLNGITFPPSWPSGRAWRSTTPSPMSWLKIAWGLGAAALVVPRLPARARLRQEPTVASSQRSSSPS
jgi:hypothetical protein